MMEVYRACYHLPLVSSGTQFASLPSAVQNTVRAEAGGYEIADVTTLTNANRVVYKIRFTREGLLPPLYVAADGSVLAPDLTVLIAAPADTSMMGAAAEGAELKLAQILPPEVMKAIQDWGASEDDVSHLAKQAWGDRTIYVISFKDPARYPTLYVSADGTILNQDTQ